MGDVIWSVDFRLKSDAKRRQEEMEKLAKAVMGLIDLDWTLVSESSPGYVAPDKEPA